MKNFFWLAIIIAGLAAFSSQVYAEGVGRSSRETAIQPKKPAKGINTGAVIIYGHLISRPYLVEYQGEILFVNGVQVEPSLAAEKTRKKPVVDEEMQALGDRMEQFTKRARKEFALGKSVDDIINLARQQDGVVSAELRSPSLIALTLEVIQQPA